MKKFEVIFGALRIPVDFLATYGAFLLAYKLRPITDLIPGVQYHFFPELLPPFPDYLRLAFFASVLLILLLMGGNLYSLKITRSFVREFLKILFWVSAWLLFIIAYYFLIVHQLFFSRIALAHIWLFTLFFILIGRLMISLIQSLFLSYGIGRRRLLFIGTSDLADQFYEGLKKDRRYEVMGCLSLKPVTSTGQLKVVGSFDDLESIVERLSIKEIIQADPEAKEEISRYLLTFCRSHQIQYHFIPDLIRLQRTNVEMEMIGGIPLISLKQTPLGGWGWIFKRLFDLGFSAGLIVLLTPLWILLPPLIKLDSPGPVIYKSRRQYRNQIFNVYKFRSMGADADEKKKALLAQNERKGPLFKIKNDPRVTRIGRFLRKTSLDEFPQFFNVLFGSMSLVGPRPHLPEEVKEYQTHHHEVFAIKPGITGLAQTSGRSDLDFEEEVKLDVFYIENWSVWLDLKILFRTIGVMLRGEGD